MTDAVTVSDEKLAPCPFCASDMSDFVSTTPAGYASAAGGFLAVECVCGVTGPFAPSMTEAIAAWNRRALVSELQQRREREGAADWRDLPEVKLAKRGMNALYLEAPEAVCRDVSKLIGDAFLAIASFASPTSPTEVKALREALNQIQSACLSEDDSAEDQLELVFGIASRALQGVRDER